MKRIWWGVSIALIAAVVVGIYLLVETVARCPPASAIAAQPNLHYLHPQQIVIRPWQGQHHVYAVFTVPVGSLAQFSFVEIPGERRYCTTRIVSTRPADGVAVPPNFYLLKTYLNTRLALWLMARGLGQELQKPAHWVAVYGQKS